LLKYLKSGNLIEFSKNIDFLKEIFSIPSLEELNIEQNTIGTKGLKFICEFLKENSHISKLTLDGIEKILLLQILL
jgi:hypothetical protein